MSDFMSEDAEILYSLRAGLSQTEPVPPDVTDFAKEAFTWRDIDAELAELDFDSIEEDLPTGVRSSATARMISFQVGQWMLDVEFDGLSGRLIGMISPSAHFTIDVHSAGAFFTTESDESGRFEAEGVSRGPLSMVLRLEGGRVIKTQWVVL